MKTLLSMLFVVSLFSGLAGSVVLSAPGILADENRNRVEFPQFDISHGVRQYFSKIDHFATDNFPFRQHFLAGYRWLVNAVGDQINADKAFRGRDGWLFLGNDYNQNIDKLEGRLDPAVEISHFAFGSERLALWFKERGVNVIFALGPNKSSIYPEKLPAIIRPSARRYVNHSMERLRNSGIPVVDPTGALLERKRRDIVYWKRDTHWNQIGASVAFEQIMDVMGIHNCPAWHFEQIDDLPGDLTGMGAFEPASERTYDNFKVVWETDIQLSFEMIEEPGISRSDSTRFYENQKPAQDATIWIIGDSYTGNMLPFFAHCFAKTGFLHYHRQGYEKLKSSYENAQSKPSHVIIMLVERGF